MEVLTNFGVQPILLLAQIINFLIIFFVLKKFFYAPIVKMLNDRKEKIAESLANADLIEQNLQKTQEESAKIMASAQSSAEELMQNAKKEAENIALAATAQSQKDTAEAMKKALEQIAQEKEAMKKDLEAQTMELVVDVVQKVLGKTMKSKEKEELTSKALSEVSKGI